MDDKDTIIISDEYGTYTEIDVECEKSPSGLHEPDWDSLNVNRDDNIYIDVNCKHCGISGCVGTQKTLEENICW